MPPPLSISRRWRRLRTRHPLLAALVVVLPAVAALDALSGVTISSPSDERARVVVASRDLPRGHEITPADLVEEIEQARPGAPVPVADPVGRVITAPVLAGEPFVAARLAPDGAEGVAALVPPGRRAIAVPISLAAPPVLVGDLVDAYLTDELTLQTGVSARVAEGAPVVAVADDAVTIALRPAEASAVAGGLAAGAVTLALTGPEG